MSRYFRQFEPIKSVLNVLFPNYCYVCLNLLTDSQTFLCDRCFDILIPLIDIPHCPICYAPYGKEHLNHKNCLGKGSLANITQNISLYPYEYPLDSVILSVKQENKPFSFKKFFDRVLSPAYINLIKDMDYVIPVPTHIIKKVTREFNPAEVMCSIIHKKTNTPVFSSILGRRWYFPDQKTLDASFREKNVQFMYYLKDNTTLNNLKILLVDDVFTTGNTLNACAKLLLQQGAREVITFTLARVQ